MVNPDFPAAPRNAMAHDPYEAQRTDMIERQLRDRGVVMHAVLEAMRDVPRHLFVPHMHADHAYGDRALPSLEGQTISQPFIVGIMTQELALKPGQRVLEIGTGTGYQTALLARLVGPDGVVCTIERVAALAEFARHRLHALGIDNVHYFVGDGTAGWPADEDWAGPRGREGNPLFDRIMVTAGAPDLPAPLLAQLGPEGIMVVPIGPADSQILMRVERKGEHVEQTEVLACRFVPLIGAHGWKHNEA
jgi:protein-L-isoaspartate(D-aspartate) O-methyltransferase